MGQIIRWGRKQQVKLMRNEIHKIHGQLYKIEKCKSMLGGRRMGKLILLHSQLVPLFPSFHIFPKFLSSYVAPNPFFGVLLCKFSLCQFCSVVHSLRDNSQHWLELSRLAVEFPSFSVIFCPQHSHFWPTFHVSRAFLGQSTRGWFWGWWEGERVRSIAWAFVQEGSLCECVEQKWLLEATLSHRKISPLSTLCITQQHLPYPRVPCTLAAPSTTPKNARPRWASWRIKASPPYKSFSGMHRNSPFLPHSSTKILITMPSRDLLQWPFLWLPLYECGKSPISGGFSV